LTVPFANASPKSGHRFLPGLRPSLGPGQMTMPAERAEPGEVSFLKAISLIGRVRNDPQVEPALNEQNLDTHFWEENLDTHFGVIFSSALSWSPDRAEQESPARKPWAFLPAPFRIPPC
jgi:hypothetical protein